MRASASVSLRSRCVISPIWDGEGGAKVLEASGELAPPHNVTDALYRSDNGRGGVSTSGDTGNAPVCCAKWWDGRREIVIPVTIALPKTIKPMATTPAISTISIWIAMVYSLARRLSDKDKLA